ncbi:uncharacterized protein [Periplaneta americana]|uniref:uncharacterized protein n=1 Tax=Periplaneta americana TaxID=6978 RepID=UPI0037E8A291
MAIGNNRDDSENIPNKMKYQCENDEENSIRAENVKRKERFQCPRCEKHFGHQQILQLHLRVHESNCDSPVKASHEEKQEAKIETVADREMSKKSTCSQTNNERTNSSPPNKKFIGLTKIRLEDCMRCDACSCIYLDENDYKKHMKNFHRQDSPKKHRQKKGCRSCCKHCNCKGNHQHHSLQKERGNNNLFHYNIKDRWSKMVSRRLTPEEMKQDIKADPDYDPNDQSGVIDYSHLLSQVEVKIKTEPPDDPEYEQNLG